ncbi:MAG: pyrroline-5-carboxylate reductase [Thermotaleaceae bacterium]
MKKVGFIGGGNMAFNMMGGLLKQQPQAAVVFSELSDTRAAWVKEKLRIPQIMVNENMPKEAQYIVLAVKPQNYIEIMQALQPHMTPEHIFISIAPGFTIDMMKEHLGVSTRIVRTMPNTPAQVGAGMSVLSFSKDNYTPEEVEDIQLLFKALGEVEVLEEKYMDAVVPISGSSPAYVYMMIEAMADAGVQVGLPRKLSYKLAAQAVLGSAKMVLETGLHPGELKDAVCSPGGTTIEAVAVLEKTGFRSSVIEAMKACYDKIHQMKK